MNRQTPESLYLDLLKKTLSFALWQEPPISIGNGGFSRGAAMRAFTATVSKVFRKFNLELVRNRPITHDDRNDGKIWPGYAHTMIGMKRLDNLQFAVETCIKEGIEGDLIETGVWRGGACILMRAILAAHGVGNRRVFVADSFEGLPKPDANVASDQGDRHHEQDFLAVSQEMVAEHFRKYGLLDEQVVFLKGWFKDTLPVAPIEKLAVMRLDGDMYASTMDALVSLYPKLSKGGFCIIDDFGAVRGCREAVADYRAQHKIESTIHEIDWTGRYWRKE
jgi:hypothetical protein